MGHAQQASATCTVPHLEYDLQASALETDKDLAKFEEEMARGSQVGRYTQFCGMPPRVLQPAAAPRTAVVHGNLASTGRLSPVRRQPSHG